MKKGLDEPTWDQMIGENRSLDHLKIIESELSDRDRALKVIVLSAFARSGSTFLSRLLAAPPASSYWHEPLRYLYEKPAPYRIFGKKKLG